MTRKERIDYLTNLTEKQLFELMSTRYTGLIDLTIDNPTSLIDWYLPSSNTYMEAKCRKKHYETIIIQKDKWDVLIQKESSWYVDSTPNGIWYFDIHKIEEPNWREKYLPQSQQFYSQGDIIKIIGEIPINTGEQLDHLLIPYS